MSLYRKNICKRKFFYSYNWTDNNLKFKSRSMIFETFQNLAKSSKVDFQDTTDLEISKITLI